MATPDEASQFNDPVLRKGLQLYCDMLASNTGQIVQEMLRMQQTTRGFESALFRTTPEKFLEMTHLKIGRIRRAAFEDDWAEYLQSLRHRGHAYADAGVPFEAWMELAEKQRRYFVGLAFAKHDPDVRTISTLVAGTLAVVDTAIRLIGAT